jgi:hypothetical protein
MSSVGKARVADIDYGFTKVQGLMLPKGEYRVGVSQIAEFLGVPHKNANRELQALLGADLQFLKINSELNPKPINSVDLKTFAEICLKLAFKGNEVAKMFCLASLEETHERRFNQAFGVSLAENEYNQKFEKRMVRVREELRLSHGGFQVKCEHHHFPARHVHDYATKLILGRTASESIKKVPINPELVEYEMFKKDFIGINHVLDEEYSFLRKLNKFKVLFSSYRPKEKEEWKQYVERVLEKV